MSFASAETAGAARVAAELIAVIAAVTQGEPRVLTIANGRGLPSGPFESNHRSLQAGLRAWVEFQTSHPLGYVEQLYTFADRDRAAQAGERIVSVSYLGLAREARTSRDRAVSWQSWYRYFPWEDRRDAAACLPATMLEHLREWAEAAPERDASLGKTKSRRHQLRP